MCVCVSMYACVKMCEVVEPPFSRMLSTKTIHRGTPLSPCSNAMHSVGLKLREFEKYLMVNKTNSQKLNGGLCSHEHSEYLGLGSVFCSNFR